MENAIELKNVSKSFDKFQLHDVSWNVKKGFVTGMIGENGAGKSTLIKIIMNLISPDTGEVQVLGMNYRNNEKEIKERIGFIYSNQTLYNELTLTDMKQLVGHSYRNWDDGLFRDYCNQFELPLRKSVENFSDGMKLKASLAIALSHHADLLIFDEPTANLDPVFRREFIELLRETMLNEEKTILLSTHNLSDLSTLADYISYIHKGKIVFSQDINEIREKYAIVRGSTDLLDRDTEKFFLSIQRTGHGFEALTECIAEVEQIFGREVVIEKASLEELMFFLREGRRRDTSNQEKLKNS